MKKILCLTILFMAALVGSAQDTFTAFLTDGDETTNIRNKPGGKVVMTVSANPSYVFDLTSPQNGWWRILEFWNAEDEDEDATLKGSDTGEYWIHFSVLGVNTRNYGGQELYLREAPDEDANVVFTFDKEMTLSPMDVQGDWVKVKVGNFDIVGWIETEWLCSNPLTNCC